jgi:hypothetical protein
LRSQEEQAPSPSKRDDVQEEQATHSASKRDDLHSTLHQSKTMNYFFETCHLDESTKDLLKDYNKSGTGVFSKEEAVLVIMDLREELRQQEELKTTNVFYRRLLLSAVVFSLFLLVSMFGLSYAVAALTAKTEVRGGTLKAKGSETIIATDSRVATFVVGDKVANATYCLTKAEAVAIQEQVFSGRTVLVEFKDVDGTSTSPFLQLSASGSNYTDEHGRACYFALQTGKKYCLTDNAQCSQRRLQSAVPGPLEENFSYALKYP